jgi:hypothetical protein
MKLTINFSSWKKLIINVNPNPAMMARIVSAAARPIPEKNPERIPLFIVLLTRSIPPGPGGMDTVRPRIIPLNIISRTGNINAQTLKGVQI